MLSEASMPAVCQQGGLQWDVLELWWEEQILSDQIDKGRAAIFIRSAI